ncbi:MAG: phage major capsid protein [Anaerorhabdus sp.]|uniref:phage major capsid protein n=1 Tax=Anaerorhabdus sp. TaxID=1872524 RepID=UPI003A8AF894
MPKLLASLQARKELKEKQERLTEITGTIEKRSSEFDDAEVERRDAILTEMEELKNEQRSLETEIKDLEQRSKTLERQETTYSIIQSAGQTVIEQRNDDSDQYDTPEYRSAFVNYMKTGDEMELRSITTDTTGIPIPKILQNSIERAWEKYGKIAGRAKKTSIKGVLTIPVEKTSSGANNREEGATTEEGEITLEEVVLRAMFTEKKMSLTDETMALAADEFLEYIGDDITQKVLVEQEKQIVSRTHEGGKGIIGIVGNKLTKAIKSALDFNTVNRAVAKLCDEVDEVIVIMNRTTFYDNIMGMTDTTGKPIYQILTDNQGKPQHFVNGLAVEFNSSLPAYDECVEDKPYMAVGDMSGYRLNYPDGSDNVKTLVDPYTKSDNGIVKLKGKLLAAGNVAKPGHFVQINKPAASVGQ